MSFPLLEDDDEAAFTDLLASLDEYTEAFDAPLEYNGRSATSSSTWHDPISETCAWAAFDAAHPLPQTTSKHRNGAREMRRREVHYLRTCVKGLQAQLSALHATIERRAQQRTRSGWEDSPTASSALVTIWKDLAARQLDQRLASERENTRLKCALEDQRKVREMLQRVLNTRVARRVLETPLTQEKRMRRVYGVALEVSDHETFQELEIHVDAVYHEATKAFFQADTGEGTCLGVFREKTLPFDLHTTADAAWTCLAQTFQHEKYTFSYSRDRRKNDELGPVQHDDTVGECFGVEIKESIADFKIKQVFRRYVELDRIVIAWRSYIDPAEFKGQKMQGFRFLEKGSIVIRPLQDAGNDLTLLRTWHVITPETLGDTKETNSQFVKELTGFVLRGSSSASTVQMIENMLIEQSNPSNHTQCAV